MRLSPPAEPEPLEAPPARRTPQEGPLRGEEVRPALAPPHDVRPRRPCPGRPTAVPAATGSESRRQTAVQDDGSRPREKTRLKVFTEEEQKEEETPRAVQRVPKSDSRDSLYFYFS